MPRHVAFLRAINVGGHTVKMDRLRALFESLGCSAVETVIASGNVVFDAPGRASAALEARIERHLEAELGYAVPTFARSPAAVAAAAAHDPFADTATAHALYVGFLKATPAAAALERLAALRSDVDDFAVHDRELYWLCRARLSDSRITGAALERIVGPTTLRNVTTVRKIAAQYAR